MIDCYTLFSFFAVQSIFDIIFADEICWPPTHSIWLLKPCPLCSDQAGETESVWKLYANPIVEALWTRQVFISVSNRWLKTQRPDLTIVCRSPVWVVWAWDGNGFACPSCGVWTVIELEQAWHLLARGCDHQFMVSDLHQSCGLRFLEIRAPFPLPDGAQKVSTKVCERSTLQSAVGSNLEKSFYSVLFGNGKTVYHVN